MTPSLPHAPVARERRLAQRREPARRRRPSSSACRPARNATNRESGDQNGNDAPLGSGQRLGDLCIQAVARQSCVLPLLSVATIASRLPSGDSAKRPDGPPPRQAQAPAAGSRRCRPAAEARRSVRCGRASAADDQASDATCDDPARRARGDATPARRRRPKTAFGAAGRGRLRAALPRARCARRRCPAAAASDPSRGSGAATPELRGGVTPAAPSSPARCARIARDRVGDGLARERDAGRSASRRARSRTPRCRSRLSTGLPARLLRAHVRRGAEDHAGVACRRASRRECERS